MEVGKVVFGAAVCGYCRLGEVLLGQWSRQMVLGQCNVIHGRGLLFTGDLEGWDGLQGAGGEGCTWPSCQRREVGHLFSRCVDTPLPTLWYI